MRELNAGVATGGNSSKPRSDGSGVMRRMRRQVAGASVLVLLCFMVLGMAWGDTGNGGDPETVGDPVATPISCTGDTHLNNAGDECVPNQRDNCPEGLWDDPDDGATECECPPGTSYDMATLSCQPIATPTPPCEGPNCCPPGYTWEENCGGEGEGGCVPDTPCATGFHRNVNGTCVPDACEPGYHHDGAGRCVPDNPDGCPTGQTRNAAGDCVPSDPNDPDDPDGCPEGTSFSAVTQSCQPDDIIFPPPPPPDGCPEGTYLKDGACVPDEKCPTGQHLESGVCVPDEPGDECPDGQHKEGGVCVPDEKCPTGTHLEAGQCVPDEKPGCPEGTYLKGGVCVPDEKCPAGQHLEAGQCVPDEPNDDCPAGQHKEGGVCVPDEKCPTGSHLENGVCVPDEGGGSGRTWSIGTALSASIITPTGVVRIAPGGAMMLTATGSDSDHWTQGTSNGDEADGVSFTWTASGGQLASSSGPNVDWTAPSAEGNYTLTCTVDDTGTTRYNDDQKTVSIMIVVETGAAPTGPSLTLASSRSTVVAGPGCDYNHATLTATLKKGDGTVDAGQSVTFALREGDPATLTDMSNAQGPLTVTATTDAKGEAKAMLTSRDEYGVSVEVKATYGTLASKTTVDIEPPEGKLDPGFDELPADGNATATVQLKLWYGDKPVRGHLIQWRISNVWDAEGTEVAAPYSGYGSLSTETSTTGDDGIARVTYQVGTLGGTIEFEGTDTSVWEHESTTSTNSLSTNSVTTLAAPVRKSLKWKEKSGGGNVSLSVTIGNVIRREGLPNSLPPNRAMSVPVTFRGNVPAGHRIVFEVINCDVNNGSAAVTANASRTTSGTITLTGQTQTEKGFAGRLRIRALYDGKVVVGLSAGFSVCAHPATIAFRFQDLMAPLRRGNILLYGARYQIDYIRSDSYRFADLDQTSLSEMITVVGSPTGIFAISGSETSGFRNTIEHILPPPALSDKHGSGDTSTENFLFGIRNAGHGTLVQNQHFDFQCDRCNGRGVVANSGFQIEQSTSSVDLNYSIHVSKKGFANSGAAAGIVDDTAVKTVPIQ